MKAKSELIENLSTDNINPSLSSKIAENLTQNQFRLTSKSVQSIEKISAVQLPSIKVKKWGKSKQKIVTHQWDDKGPEDDKYF